MRRKSISLFSRFILPGLALLCLNVQAANQGGNSSVGAFGKTKPVNEKNNTTGAVVDDSLKNVASPADAAASTVSWYVVSGGGRHMSDGANYLAGTVGQVAAGVSGGSGTVIHHGYWQNFGAGEEPCCGRYTGGETGNTDCDIEGKRTLSDVTTLIANIYVTHALLCCAANGNVDGDIEGKLTLNDIMNLIDNIFIDHTPCAPCP